MTTASRAGEQKNGKFDRSPQECRSASRAIRLTACSRKERLHSTDHYNAFQEAKAEKASRRAPPQNTRTWRTRRQPVSGASAVATGRTALPRRSIALHM
jgi:hypothetical protein